MTKKPWTPTARRKHGKSPYKFERKVSAPSLSIPKKYTGFTQPPEDIDSQNELIKEMIEWAINDETAMDPEKFPIMKCINPYRFKRIGDENEFFKEGYQIANYIIGVRLKEKTRNRELDKDYLFKFLPMYNPEFKELLESQKRDESAIVTQRIVVLTQTPESPLVPLKEEKDNEMD